MFNNPFGLLFMFGRQKPNGMTLKITLSCVLLVSVLLLILLTACSPATQGNPVPTYEADKGHVSGKILSVDGKPYAQFSVRLAEVYWQDGQGAYVLDESFSPGAISDEKGSFLVLNAPAGEYVLIISEPMKTYLPVTDATGVLTRLTVKAGETIDLGTIKFDYKP